VKKCVALMMESSLQHDFAFLIRASNMLILRR